MSNNKKYSKKHSKSGLFSTFGRIFLSLLLCSFIHFVYAINLTNPADPAKVLRTVFPAAETGFDPAAVSDLYSASVIQGIFEPLFTYDYLARPAKLAPLTAQALPEVTDGGKTYTIRLKKGIVFAPDPAFNSKQRELTMADYVYSFQRLMDPKIASPHVWLFAGKVLGLDEMVAKAKKTGKFNPTTPVAGFELLDRYTLRVHLTRADLNFGMSLAHFPASAVAREVVEKYQNQQGHVMDHPVGTGAYRLTQWVRSSRMVLDANPSYRGFVWDFQPGADPDDQHIAAQMQGKRMPRIGRVEINVIVEDQSRWLSFQKGEIDLFQLEGPLAPQALSHGRLKPELVKKGVQLSRMIDPELTIYYWNMQDPITGGLDKEKIALRRAFAMAHNVQEEVNVVWHGEAIALKYPIPPGIVGYDPKYVSRTQYNVAGANALLDRFGYKKGPDGWRTLPNGHPLVIRYSVRADSLGKQQLEVWKKTFNAISVQMEGDMRPFPDLLKAEAQCKLQMRSAAWIADYPDGDNFMQLFYGPNIHQTNKGCFQHPDYDRLFLQSQQMQPGPERDALYRKMARLLEVYAPNRLGYARYRNMLAQANVIGYKKHPILVSEWIYFDLKK